MLQNLFFDSRISYVVQVVPVAVLAGAVFLLAHCKANWDRTLVFRLLFVSYAAALVGIVLVPANFWTNLYYPMFYGTAAGGQMTFLEFTFNLEPTLLMVVLGRHTMGSWGWFMMGANALLLVPFGLLHPLAYPGKKTLKVGLLAILAIECLQPIVGRSFDVDDILCNGLGLLMGYAIYKLFR